MLDIILGFLTGFHPVISIFMFSIIILVIINICYKFLIKQDEIAAMKRVSKELNRKMKKSRKENNTDETKKLMSESMKVSNQMMKKTMKPMIVSLIVVALLLPWAHAHYNDVYIAKNQSSIMLDGEEINVASLSIPAEKIVIAGNIWNIFEVDDKIQFQRVVAALPISLPMFGDDLGWLGWYFIVSIPFMFIIRKLMGIQI
ncbi:MAG: EMC3/TMCO1 family protein [Candidatus Aenigmatarchaeota archaeon]